jgi:hypothetical protein
MRAHFSLTRLFAVMLPIAWLLSACSPATPGPVVPSQNPTSLPTSAASPTPPPQATATETSEPGRIVLLAPPGADPGLKASLAARLSEAAARAGLETQTIEALSAAEITPAVRLVAAIPPATGVAELAAAAPQTRFVTVSISGVAPTDNLVALGAVGSSAENDAFLAGYAAELIAADWRAGVLAAGETPEGARVQQAFMNGARFFCGLCKPAYPPFFTYPQSFTLPGAADGDPLAGLLAELDKYAIDVLYVDAPLASADLLQSLADAGVKLIAPVAPPAGLEAGWVVTIGGDPLDLLPGLLPTLLDGSLSGQVEPGVELSHLDSGLLSEARLRLLQEVMEELNAGRIDPLADND